jgi:hypothetical protein
MAFTQTASDSDLFLKKADKYLPVVVEAINSIWPTMPMRSFIPSQIEQESCISAKHSKCWNPNVELRTSRELGFGLGQLTIAYKADGSVRFNAWEEIKDKDPSLKNWAWADRYNPLLQIKAIVVKDRFNFQRLTFPIASTLDRMAFTAVTYNAGSVVKDRSLCLARTDCDASKWFAANGKFGVESFSTKSKVPQKGYGKSFFEISREYPKNVLFVRRGKYVPYTGE